MRFVLLMTLAVACGQPRPVAPPTQSVEDVAAMIGRAGLAGDRKAATELTLSYAEMQRISNKDRGKQDWDEAVASFFDQLGANTDQDAQHRVELVGARVVKSGTLTPGRDEKVLRDVEYAFVTLIVKRDGEQEDFGPPLLFLRTDRGWRFSPRQ